MGTSSPTQWIQVCLMAAATVWVGPPILKIKTALTRTTEDPPAHEVTKPDPFIEIHVPDFLVEERKIEFEKQLAEQLKSKKPENDHE